MEGTTLFAVVVDESRGDKGLKAELVGCCMYVLRTHGRFGAAAGASGFTRRLLDDAANAALMIADVVGGGIIALE